MSCLRKSDSEIFNRLAPGVGEPFVPSSTQTAVDTFDEHVQNTHLSVQPLKMKLPADDTDPHLPRLERLKDLAFARRRSALSEYNTAPSVPTRKRDEGIGGESNNRNYSIISGDGDDDLCSSSSIPMPCAPADALRILHLDNTPKLPPCREDDGHSRAQRLQAVRCLAQRGAADLRHLSTRLRQTTAHLAFHESNSLSLITQSHQTSQEHSTAQRPWLPPTAPAGNSKHKAQRGLMKNSNSLSDRYSMGLVPSNQPIKHSSTHTSLQTSVLQVKLLSSLLERLRLKIGFAVLRRAAQVRKMTAQLLERVECLENYDVKRSVMVAWRQEARQRSERAHRAVQFLNAREKRTAQQVVYAWRRWNTLKQQHYARITIAESVYHRRVLMAALSHWKVAAAVRQLSMLRAALVETWQQTWGTRKALLAWRRTSQRRRLQRSALQSAASRVPPLLYVVEQSAVASSSDEQQQQGGGGVHQHQHAKQQPSSLAELALASQRAAAREDVAQLRAAVVTMAAKISFLMQSPSLRWRHSFFNSGYGTMQRPVLYNPAVYASPVKQQHTRRNRSKMGAAAFFAAEEMAAELFACREEVEEVEKECDALRTEITLMEGAMVDVEDKCSAAAASVKAGRAAVLAADEEMKAAEAAEQHVKVRVDAATADIERHRVTLEECLRKAAEKRRAAEVAATALVNARDQCTTSHAAAAEWKCKVSEAAVQLSRASASSKSVAAVKVKEARHRLEVHESAAAAAQSALPLLISAAEDASLCAEESETELVAAQQAALAAAAAEATASSRWQSARARSSTAAAELESVQEETACCAQHHEAVVSQASALKREVSRKRQYLFTLERQLTALRVRASELDERHALSVAAALVIQDHKEEEESVMLLKDDSSSLALPTEIKISYTSFSSSASSPLSSTPPDLAAAADKISSASPSSQYQCSVTAAARHYHRCRLLHRAVRALQIDTAQWRDLHAAAAYSYCVSRLPDAFVAWRSVTGVAVENDADACEVLRTVTCFNAWAKHTARMNVLRNLLDDCLASKNRSTKAACFAALRENVATQQRHRAILVRVSSQRAAAVLETWRHWAAVKTQCRDTLQIAVERRRFRTLTTSLQKWRSNAHAAALLRRVLTRACELWRGQIGAAGYEAEFSVMQRFFSAWHLAAHHQMEERREGILALAAQRLSDRRLLKHAFSAMKREVEWANEKEHYVPLAHAALLAWRHTAATSEAHTASTAAQQHYNTALKRRAFNAWITVSTATACVVSLFYLKWQSDRPLAAALQAWRGAVAAQRRWDSRRSAAEVVRKKHASPGGVCDSMGNSVDKHGSSSTAALIHSAVAVHRMREFAFLTPSSSATTDSNNRSRASPKSSSGAHSVTPLYAGSSSAESWHAKAEEWRRRRDVTAGYYDSTTSPLLM